MKAPMVSSFKDRAYQHIRAKIMRGVYVAGERLSEEALASEIGISRTPVREALGRLASEGLARQLPHYGVFVRKFEREELIELYELRILLESYAVGRAAERRTDDQLLELDAICNGLQEVAHTYRDSEMDEALAERQRVLDVRFHQLVLTAAASPQTMKVAGDLRLLTQICGRSRFDPAENLLHILARTHREHQAIVTALRRRDSAAAKHWMRRHLERGMGEGLAAFDRAKAAEPASPRQSQADQIDHFTRMGAL